ncbi:MAG TPA: ABC-type transport auxiliary lipoprotein family protein [Steroidobacteraceae bacterium]|nr:ABC-type transport auxiliary lipoprotein family protein [Steroidobacteraceae bacterium]
MRIAAKASILALAGCATACTGSLFQSKAVAPTIYLLSGPTETAAVAASSAASPAPPAPVAVNLAVLKPRVRAGLDTDRIAVLYPDRRLDYFADARWSGPVDDVVQDLAVQAFRSGARLQNVSSDASTFASGYWLEIEVADFQAEYPSARAPPTVNVRLLARVASAGNRNVLGAFRAGSRQTAADNRLSAIVDAYERAVNSALAEIVGSTTRTLTDHSLEQR